MKTLHFILFACLLGLAVTVHAGVVAVDLEIPGDGLLTYDTIHNREWLDLPETNGLRLADVMAQMTPGGRLNGFRFAMLEVVAELLDTAEVGWTDPWMLPGELGSKPHELVKLLGVVMTLHNPVFGDHLKLTGGLVSISPMKYSPVFDNTNVFVLSLFGDAKPGGINVPVFAQPSGGAFESSDLTSDLFPDVPAFAIGDIGPFWLYRAVPEPSSGVLLFLGFGVGMLKRDKSRR